MVEGTAVAKKMIGGENKVVKEYSEGEYFGERALIKEEPRAATIEVTSETATFVSLEKGSFQRLLGNLEDVFKRNMEVYA